MMFLLHCHFHTAANYQCQCDRALDLCTVHNAQCTVALDRSLASCRYNLHISEDNSIHKQKRDAIHFAYSELELEFVFPTHLLLWLLLFLFALCLSVTKSSRLVGPAKRRRAEISSRSQPAAAAGCSILLGARSLARA